MKEIKGGGVDLFLSNGIFEELKERFHESSDINENIASYLGDKVDNMFREDKKFQRYIEIYSEIFGLKGFALLEAEGEVLIGNLDDGYWDGKRLKRVQGWIDKHDGEYTCLFLRVSEISRTGLESSKSILFIPDEGVSKTAFSIFSPIHGSIDNYTIDFYQKEIEELRNLPLDELKVAVKERRYKEWLQMGGLEDESI